MHQAPSLVELEGESKWMTLTWFLRPDRYEGEVIDGHMHGKGTYWHADSSRCFNKDNRLNSVESKLGTKDLFAKANAMDTVNIFLPMAREDFQIL